MFYTYLRGLVAFILWVLNGNAHYHHKDNIPDREENYILVSPHRTWWDPVYMAFATKPKQFIFMAKKELFTNRIFGWWIRMCGAFPIDRENPGAEAIKYPVNMLKKSNRSLIMFPSAEVARRIQEEFDRLDAEAQAINTPTKPLILIRLLKILLIPLVLVVGILTLLFSYLASFVWDPDKHRKNK